MHDSCSNWEQICVQRELTYIKCDLGSGDCTRRRMDGKTNITDRPRVLDRSTLHPQTITSNNVPITYFHQLISFINQLMIRKTTLY